MDDFDPRASVNRIVVIEKPNGKLRLCLDPSDLNKQIIRKPRLVPKLEDISSQILGKKYFTVFDLAEGYHHIELDEHSSWKCCFSTPFGMYRYIVLPYGLSSSQDIFQEQVENNFSNIKNVQICHDDMIVMGSDKFEHDRAVEQVVQRARQVGAKFNKDKLQYFQTEVKFMGQVFSEKGMEIDPDRVKALVLLENPKNKVELQRVLGSFNYVRRYVVNMAHYIQPLCELLKSNTEWLWLPKHEECFKKLKEIVCKSPALIPFDPKKVKKLSCSVTLQKMVLVVACFRSIRAI